MSAPHVEGSGSALEIFRHADHWVLRLSRPSKMNAFDVELVEALIAAIAEAEKIKIPLLILEGAGRNFSGGFDLSNIEMMDDSDLLWRFVRLETLLQAVAYSSCATMALVHGKNFGAGVDLVAACRWRVATADSTFCMPGLKFGLVLGTGRLVGLVGAEVARGMLETARVFDASEACKLGFLRVVASKGDWGALVEQAIIDTQSLSYAARQRLFHLSRLSDPDCDMAELVRSASTPGLKQRIQRYRSQAL